MKISYTRYERVNVLFIQHMYFFGTVELSHKKDINFLTYIDLKKR